MKGGICRIMMTAGAYTAAFAGGGFASGKEITEFFVRHGSSGAAAVAVSALLFGIYAYAVLEICRREDTRSCAEFTRCVFGKTAGTAVQAYICVFSAVILGAMVSAAGETGWIFFGINRTWTAVLICALVSVFVISGIRNIAVWEGILGIITAVGIIAACWYIINFRLAGTFASKPYISSGASYTGYNLLGTTAVLCGMSRYIKSRREAAATAALSFLMLLFMMGMMWLTINIFYDKIPLGSIPMLTIILRMGKMPAAVYSLIITVSIFTTAVSAAYGISDTFSGHTGVKTRACMVFVTGLVIGSVEFDIIVTRLYYWMGICGFLITAYVYTYFIGGKNEKNKRGSRGRGYIR